MSDIGVACCYVKLGVTKKVTIEKYKVGLLYCSSGIVLYRNSCIQIRNYLRDRILPIFCKCADLDIMSLM